MRANGLGPMLLAIAATMSLAQIAAPTPAAAAGSTVSVGDASVVEGTAGRRNLVFAVTLDAPSVVPVVVRYRVVGLDATAGSDYVGVAGTRTMTFALNARGVTPVAKYVSVAVNPDSVDEADEHLAVVVDGVDGAALGRAVGTGTILDDDPIGNGFRVSVGDGAVVEGAVGARSVKFTVALSQTAPAPVSVKYTVAASSAATSADFRAVAAKTLTFAAGSLAKTVVVPVLPDAASEGTETFTVTLSAPSVGVLIARSTGIGSILDDEPARRPLMGTAVRWPTLLTDTDYAQIAGRRFDVVTPENEMKWDATEPQRGLFNFGAADAIVAFARAHGETVHGHALAWHAQNPAWLTGGSFTRAELVDILTNHITTLATRYRGAVSVWDVANETVDDAGTGLRPTVWSQGIGPDYLDLAFRAAAAADPDARLFVNDYGIEGPGPKADALYAVVAGLVARGVPIDGVGFQAHVTPGTLGGLAGQFARYAALGLDVAVTELDVRIPTPATASTLAAQASTYRTALDACRNATNCTSFTTWGFTDRYSWIPSWFPGTGAALPWDAALAPKPAYAEIASALRN